MEFEANVIRFQSLFEIESIHVSLDVKHKGEKMSKRKVLTLDDHVRVIELSKFKSARNIAEEFQVGKTQIQNILKRKAEVLQDVENNVSGERKRMRRLTGNEEINDLVLEWFKDATARRMPVSGPLLSQQALKFADNLGNHTFKASTRWLASFIKRNNIAFGTMSGERGDVDTEVVECWKAKLPTLCHGYDPHNIFNLDETGLFFQDTTRKSYHMKDEELTGGKRSKERLTVSLCASMTGEKMKPLVIGKSAKPRCFKSIKPESLPVMYRNNKTAWMTGDLMSEWLRSVDKQMKRQGRKILLFLDNAPAHPHLNLPNVKLVFLPANTTSLSQPMDQGIIQTLKLKYRKRQLQHILVQMERTDRVGSDILRGISILDGYWISDSWKEVESSTIQKCFNRCGFSNEALNKTSDEKCVGECDEGQGESQRGMCDSDDDDNDDDDDDVPLAVLKMSCELFGCGFGELVDIDKKLATCNTCTSVRDWNAPAYDILKDIREEKGECDDDDDDDDDDDNDENDVSGQTVISMDQAHEMIDKLKTFALHKGKGHWLDSIMSLESMFTSSRAEFENKLTKISDFFK